ncbi:MAG TPA: NUDIX hydrolase [Pantanalinema sp.]
MSHPKAPRIRVCTVLPQDDHLLMVRHRKGDKSYWMLPGGGLDFGESFEQCAIREIKEETGLDIAIERMLYLSEAICPRGSRHVVNIYLLGRIEGGVIAVPEEDVIDAVAFIPVAGLNEVTLYPAIASELQAAHAAGYTGAILNLGSMWTD